MLLFFRAVLTSLLLALWLELFYKLGVTTDLPNLYGAVLVYTLVLLPVHLLMGWLNRVPDRLWFLLWGLLGLMGEWFVIGNSPWGNPEALHLPMFVFHGTYPVWGRIFDPARFEPNQRRAGLLAIGLFTLLGLAGRLIPSPDLRLAWFLFVPLGLYFSLAAMTLLHRPRG